MKKLIYLLSLKVPDDFGTDPHPHPDPDELVRGSIRIRGSGSVPNVTDPEHCSANHKSQQTFYIEVPTRRASF